MTAVVPPLAETFSPTLGGRQGRDQARARPIPCLLLAGR